MDIYSSKHSEMAAGQLPERAGAPQPACAKNVRAAGAVPAVALLLALAAPAGAQAETLTIDLAGTGPVQTISAKYSCKGGVSFTAQYINAGSNSLAVLPVQGQTLIFAQGLSADGGRYVSGPYVWWSKGNTASLFDTHKGENAPAVLTCTSK